MLFRHIKAILIFPFTVTVLLPLLLSSLFSPDSLFTLPSFFLIKPLSIAFYIIGLLFLLITNVLFHFEGNGTLAPFDPPTKFVVKGPYRFCRNPMISGVILMLLGEAFFLNSSVLLAFSGCFFCVKTCYFIWEEEPELRKRFGVAYERFFFKKNKKVNDFCNF